MESLKKKYEDKGYVVCENLLRVQVIEEVRAVIDELLEKGSALQETDDVYEILEDLATGMPRIERIKGAHKIHPLFNQLIRRPEITEVLRTLLGPNVRFQNCKLNLKSKGGGAPVEWHQDWAFYPHTNDDVLAVGIMIDDMTKDNGAVQFAAGSHRGPVYDHMSDGVFCGAVGETVAKQSAAKADQVTGEAGTVTFHHARLLHASHANRTELPRRFLIYEVTAADAWPLNGTSTSFESWQNMQERMIIGVQTNMARLTDVPVRIPQPTQANATSIFEIQRRGDNKFYMRTAVSEKQ